METLQAKKGVLGDAINWESLLEYVPNDENLTVISSDGDFEAPFSGLKIKEFLSKEWKTKKGAEVTLYKSLTKFLQANFPNIKLSDEIAKAKAIECLELSGSFSETHSTISQLSKYADFKEDEIERILNAYLYNSQVRQILHDEDVLGFAQKTAKLTDKSDLELAARLKTKLEEIDSTKSGSFRSLRVPVSVFTSSAERKTQSPKSDKPHEPNPINCLHGC